VHKRICECYGAFGGRKRKKSVCRNREKLPVMRSYRESVLKILLGADVLFENSDGVADGKYCEDCQIRQGVKYSSTEETGRSQAHAGGGGGGQIRVVCNSSDGILEL
jgi:hypothetical protein